MPLDAPADLTVPPELAARLRAIAERTHVDVDDLVTSALDVYLDKDWDQPDGEPRMTPAEAVDWMLTTRHRRKLPDGMTIEDLIAEARG